MNRSINEKDDKGNFLFRPLGFPDFYLEPYIWEHTVRYHYYRHLKAYIAAVNNLKGDYPSDVTIEKIIEDSPSGKLYNNASQVFNHYFYFDQLHADGVKNPLPMMQKLLCNQRLSLPILQRLITDRAMSIFGSGWVYLIQDSDGGLTIETYTGTGTPIRGKKLLALDMWEHAYYLDYQNDKERYIENFFKVIDWSVVERRLIS